MKAKFNVKEIGIKDFKIGGIEIETEFSPSELLELYKLQREILKDIPEILCELARGYATYEEMSDRLYAYFNGELDEELEEENNELDEEEIDNQKERVENKEEVIANLMANFIDTQFGNIINKNRKEQ